MQLCGLKFVSACNNNRSSSWCGLFNLDYNIIVYSAWEDSSWWIHIIVIVNTIKLHKQSKGIILSKRTTLLLWGSLNRKKNYDMKWPDDYPKQNNIPLSDIWKQLELELHLKCISKSIKVSSHGLVHGRRTAPQYLQIHKKNVYHLPSSHLETIIERKNDNVKSFKEII